MAKKKLSKDMREFLKENTAQIIRFRDPTSPNTRITTVENAAVLVHMNADILIIHPNKVRLIPWELVLEIIYPFNEKLVRYAMIGSHAMEEGVEMMGKKKEDKEDDKRGFQ